VSITASELLARIDAHDAPAILDVRSAWEFKRGHVPGAIHLPFWTIGAHLSQIPGTPADPVVVYCAYGPRAWGAGGLLRRNGFQTVIYLKGHMHGWRRAGLREEKAERPRPCRAEDK
jgi:rhodanese-related sulfurtransferase